MNIEAGGARYSPDFDQPVRGDTITADRYTSSAWMKGEHDRLWPHVWHLGGVIADLEEPGDVIRHNFGRESIIMVKQDDGGVKAFYNACPHRGNRLILGDVASSDRIICSYHGWQFDTDGTLVHVQDPHDFPGGDPCGRVQLKPLRCETWGPFVFWNMDMDAAPLLDWLDPYPQRLEAYGLENWIRVFAVSADCDFNWKIIRDNFNESYHLPTIHPELSTFINDGLPTTVFEMYENGHNAMWMVGHQATTRQDFHSGEVPETLGQVAAAWGIRVEDYHGRTGELRAAVIAAKRKLGKERGYANYERMSDQQLVDYFHCTLWPNLTITMSPEQCQILRTEPHPTDPGKCVFQHWCLYPPVAGMKEVETPVGMLPLRHDALVRHGYYGDGNSLGFVADQDLSIGTTQQQGLNSRGFDGCILSHQEKRIQRFHELLNDVVLGTPPQG
ncbi:aromatic ring-hydroxylating dioxygenase subunit alpha [Croceicoccus sp. F390]|uniref:Aromatic ring-hydroxylating dioxygenase subunit alpha n=1 Tax=Croceicoccus esteveae TaxID=3075597 RepID=A0ABU2ZHB6_9SPHN|nr:aromatic ring-hydroxylating dioxygenase subunit alpha [Croceicoccus sp. F390]MDT0575996.1 aromatic ring-hydroxylating dioxygenase subunit alpha [Croceicoccus sp. F390]